MVIKEIRIDGSTIKFEWHTEPVGDGGLVSQAPGVVDFYADSLDDAMSTLRSLYSRAADA